MVVGGGGDVHPELVVVTGRDLHGQGDALLSCRGEGHLVAAAGHLLLRVASVEFRDLHHLDFGFVISNIWISIRMCLAIQVHRNDKVGCLKIKRCKTKKTKVERRRKN